MKQIKIDMSYIVKKAEGNTVIFIPTDNVNHHITVISENYPELLEKDSVYIVHLNHYRLFNVYEVKYKPEKYPIAHVYRMVDYIPDGIKKPVSEVLSSGYTYQLNNVLGSRLRICDDVEVISNIIDAWNISVLDSNVSIIDGVPHIIVLEDIDDDIEWDIHHQIKSYINEGYNTINITNIYLSDDEFHQKDTIAKVTVDGKYELINNPNPYIDFKTISTEWGIYTRVRGSHGSED